MTEPPIGTDTFGVFGTTAALLVTRPGELATARAIADELLAEVDLAASRFRPDSELARLNAASGQPVPVSTLFAELLAAALRAARLTGGDVDPTCGTALVGLGYDRDFAGLRDAGDLPAPPAGTARPVPGWHAVHLDPATRIAWLERGAEVDLGATAKAWAADRCAARIGAETGGGVLISLGGDIAVAGQPPDGGWQIRVTDDHSAPASAPGQTVAITSGGLATSSTTVRTWTAGGRPVHHIVDPATGEPAESCWRTVSVAAGTCVDANTASTAAIIRGQSAPGWLTGLGLPARLVGRDGAVVATAGWPGEDGPADAP
ncbi:MAG TPA: FAD:protein FMN transferase [Streptosporangiaceae bacterium]|jgi:thiamine biosynthesis lipoprotein